MTDVRKEWFYQQHFSTEELEQLHQWNGEQGMKAIVAMNDGGNYGGYHIADKGRTIMLVAYADKGMCETWIRRLGFELEENGA